MINKKDTKGIDTTKVLRKGQISFDMVFAIIVVILVMGSIINYFKYSESSVMPARKLIGLHLMADYAYGNLHEFYNSIILTGNNASYNMKLLDKYLYSNEGKKYEINYTVSFDRVGPVSAVYVTDPQNPLLSIERKFVFRIDCNAGNLPLAGSPAKPGDFVNLTECKPGPGASDKLECKRCN